MANTITQSKGLINLVLDEDWTWTDAVPEAKNGLEVAYVIFQPGAENDKLILVADNDNGPRYFPSAVAQSASDVKLLPGYGLSMRLHIDYDTCVLSSGHLIIIAYK
jgi:hypothetical protein